MLVGVNLTITVSGTLEFPNAVPQEQAEALGPELWPQPDLNAADGLTLNGWTVETGHALSNGSNGVLEATALEPLTPGTYRVVGSYGGEGGLSIQVGGVGSVVEEAGAFTRDIVTTAVMQSIRVRDVDTAGLSLESLSVKRVL